MNDDGRNILHERGALVGEASAQRRAAAPDVPSFDERGVSARDTYYDQPVIKEPVWIWSVPAYFFTGGAAGAAAVLAAVARAVGDDGSRRLVRRGRRLAAAGTGIGTVFLIHDLGRPERFLNMLRVFRPTSPMSVGSWVLAASSGAAAAAAALEDRTPRLADAAGLAAGALGPPLSGYAAMLLSNSAVPLWQRTRRELPHLFVGSSITSAAGLLELLDCTEDEATLLRRFGLVGKVYELVAGTATERAAGSVERVGKPLHEGASAVAWKASKVLTAASLALSLARRPSASRRRASAALAVGGGILVRFAVFRAGKASARDPRASFDQQLAGGGGFEATGRPATTGAHAQRG